VYADQATHRRERVVAAGVLLAALAVSLVSYRIYFSGGITFEFCHYAEIARNVIEGRGFWTATWYPSYQAQFDAANIPIDGLAPVLDRFPLQAAWVAIFEACFGATDFAVVLAQALAHALWCAAIFVFGRRMFPERVALGAALLWALNPMLAAGYVIHGYADVLFGLLFLGLNVRFATLLHDGSAAPARMRAWVATGALLGACYLSRYSVVVFVPVYAGALLARSGLARGARRCAGAAAGYLAVVVPWSAYYFVRSGVLAPPLFIQNLAHGVLLNGLPWMDYRVFALSEFASGPALRALGVKWLTLFFRLLEDLPAYWYLSPAALLAAAWLLSSGGSPAKRFGRFCALLLLWQGVVFSFLRYETLGYMTGRYYLTFGPIVLLGAGAWLDELRQTTPHRWRAWAGRAVVTIILVDYGFRYAHIGRGNDHPERLDVPDWPELRWITEHTGPRDLIVSNIPAQIAWYAHRTAVNVTNEPAGLGALLVKHRPAYLLLSATRVGEIDNYPAWRALLKGDSRGLEAFCAEYGFEVVQTFKGGIVLRSGR
jgi:4-amino-4-deoxy-L-arabinose transferase-like glycosyltransferase